MQIKTGFLCLAMFMPLSSFAAKGEFIFKFADEDKTMSASCIERVNHVEQDDFGDEYLDIIFTQECENSLKQISLRNIGKQVVVSYNGNALSKFTIFGYTSKNVRLSAKGIPRVILMKILDDYGVALQK